MQMQSAPGWIGYVIPAVIALVLILRVRSMRRAQRLRLETLWIVPAAYLLAFGVATWEYPPPTLLGWLWLLLAGMIGAAIGWRRGKLMRISVDPDTHALNQQGSPAALLFIILLIVARQGLRYEGQSLGLNVLQVTGIMLASGVGLFGATRLEMYVRARRLLTAARAA